MNALRRDVAATEYSDPFNHQFRFKPTCQSKSNLPSIPIQTRPLVPTCVHHVDIPRVEFARKSTGRGSARAVVFAAMGGQEHGDG